MQATDRHTPSAQRVGMERKAEQLFRDAQKSFRAAGAAQTIEQTERFAKIGRDYLHLAHEAAQIDEKSSDLPSMWPLQGSPI